MDSPLWALSIYLIGHPLKLADTRKRAVHEVVEWTKNMNISSCVLYFFIIFATVVYVVCAFSCYILSLGSRFFRLDFFLNEWSRLLEG